MSISNKAIIDKLNELADILDIKGESQFRVRAYRNAARSLSGVTRSLAEMVALNEDISLLPGIGKSMSEKIEEIVKTGELRQLKELKKQIPDTLVEIMKLEQLGPQRTKILSEELNIRSIEELKIAAKAGKIEHVKGFGKKTAEKILKEIESYASKGGSKRIKWSEAELIVKSLLAYLEGKLEWITVAGSFRRKKETVGDIDLVAVSKNPVKAMKVFTSYDEVDQILSEGETRSTVKLRSGLQVDLRIVEKNAFGAALMYFTGSKEHTVALRTIAQEQGLKLNEYGIFKNNKVLASSTEEEVYNIFGMTFIEPELRENKGEIEASMENKLPRLVERKDICGDLHSHTNETDGKNTLEEMANAARAMGYEYLAVTDHSKKVAMARGLDEKRLTRQIAEINNLNENLKNFRLLKAIEVDILEDGSLDLPDTILKELDLVVCSVHYYRKLTRKKQTQRILKAMQNPFFNILGHPTGRMIGKRDELDVDMEAVMKEAKNSGCFMEINCNPDRLDLNDDYARRAKELGVKISVATDAHSVNSLQYINLGIAQARRGWLQKEDVINTRSLNNLMKLLKR
jgi:DNA polymerase (family X)